MASKDVVSSRQQRKRSAHSGMQLLGQQCGVGTAQLPRRASIHARTRAPPPLTVQIRAGERGSAPGHDVVASRNQGWPRRPANLDRGLALVRGTPTAPLHPSGRGDRALIGSRSGLYHNCALPWAPMTLQSFLPQPSLGINPESLTLPARRSGGNKSRNPRRNEVRGNPPSYV